MNDSVSLTQRLAACYTGAVFDVLRSRGFSNTVLPKEIAPLDAGMTVAGPVFTVVGSPKPNFDPHQSLIAWTEFLSRAPRGTVVVCEGNDTTRALMGELSAETLKFRGVRGYVTDGASRDCGFIKRIGFPVFCRGKTPRDIVGAWTPDAFNEPIALGGCRIAAGDYVIGDIDGVVVIPGDLIASVVNVVETVMQTENLVRKAILEGVDPKEAYLHYGKF
jgi:4-hydroxy-4-methyl-2-oxoglutarate aldolase